MEQGRKKTITIRIISTSFVVLTLAVFKPFGLDVCQWLAYVHLLVMGGLGVGICVVTDSVLKYVFGMPASYNKGMDNIVRRNIWFQCINTPLVALMICLYRHFVLSEKVEGNQLSLHNFGETLLILLFCSLVLNFYWYFKFRNGHLAAELLEAQKQNEQLQKVQQKVVQQIKTAETASVDKENEKDTSNIILTGTTNESVTLQASHLIYIETLGNYVKVCRLCNGEIRTDRLRATSKQIENELRDYPAIVRCHRSFLVNLQQVERIVSQQGTMQLFVKHCHESLPVSRSNMAQIKKSYCAYSQ